MEKIIVHVDVNNAFLSWTAVDKLKKGEKLDIRNTVCVIGGDEQKRNGIVLAKSTPAKTFGIVTAETLMSARGKYKNLVVYPPNHELYEKYSEELYEYLSTLTPLIEQASIDESFLDMTGMNKFTGDIVEFAENIKTTIKIKFGYTVNVGIANNKLCAKMASDFSKPDKVHTLFDYEIKNKLWPLEINQLFMVGKKTTEKLKEMGIKTIKDLSDVSMDTLISLFKKQGILLYEYSHGIDGSPVINNYDIKGIGNSRTYPIDLDTVNDIKKELLKLSSIVGRRIRKAKKKASVVTLTIKYSSFKSFNKQIKLPYAISSDEDIYNVVCKILSRVEIEPIRNLGIRLTSFMEENMKQISMFDSEIKETNNLLQNTIDNLKDKYGEEIIGKASI